MEVLVEVLNAKSCRPLICDICGESLMDSKEETYSFFAQFWRDDFRKLYLEKFICPNCLRLFPNAIRYDFENAPEKMVELIQSQLERDDYGYFLSFNSVDKVKLLLENPSLIYLSGEKLKEEE